jgi:N-acetylglutamate synthase-like GNAT family acetyltransferase
MEAIFLQNDIICQVDVSRKKDLYDFHTKNHLDISPTKNIYETQIKDIPRFFTRLIDEEIFIKDLFWIVSTKEDKNIIIGSIGLSINKDDPSAGELNTLSVSPGFRNKGIGTELIKYVIKKAKDHDLKRIYLVTTDYMKNAVSLYLKFGFKAYQDILIKVDKGVSVVTNDINDYNQYKYDKFKATYYELKF